MGVVAGCEHPVLAHLYLNFLLDNDNAEKNFTFVGYLPALTKFTLRLRDRPRAWCPRTSRNCIPTQDEIDKALYMKPLGADGDAHVRRPPGRSSPPAADRVTAVAHPSRRAPTPTLAGDLAVLRDARRRLADRVLRRVGVRRDGRRVRHGRPVLRTAVPAVEPAPLGLRGDRATCSTECSAATSARCSSARSGSSSRRSAGCIVIGYPVAYYVARKAGRRRGLRAGAAGAAVLDQLPDAHAGLDEPAAARRHGEPTCCTSCTCRAPPTQLARRQPADRDHRPRLRLRAVLHPAAVLDAGTHRRPAHRGRPRPRRRRRCRRSSASRCRCRCRA